ncbi:NADH-quinone oxidoreductase subunit J [Streptacidiphilus sp. EB129]|uniref:NADH-quinone oxidoreductase subunit J n=1 Tax=Streptacidiphilus sp. EB129 TaxID=3156262 RepID=UPI0035121B81
MMSLAAAPLTGQASLGEAVQFWVLAVLAVSGALGMVLCKKAVHSALCLAGTMISLAICYMAQGAVFLGVVQIVVYTGAIMMLFLFVVMLVGVSSADSAREVLKGQRWAAVIAGLGFGVLLIAGLANARLRSFTGVGAANSGGNVQGLAKLIFTQYVWAFEVTGALLITAAVGAMVLTHREATEERQTQRELAEQRVRLGQQVTPLPAPGVYARHNAVDVPGLLPDGTVSELSVNPTLRSRGQMRDVSGALMHRMDQLEADTADWLGRRAPKPRQSTELDLAKRNPTEVEESQE